MLITLNNIYLPELHEPFCPYKTKHCVLCQEGTEFVYTVRWTNLGTQILLFPSVIIPPLLHTHLHLEITLIRRKNR